MSFCLRAVGANNHLTTESRPGISPPGWAQSTCRPKTPYHASALFEVRHIPSSVRSYTLTAQVRTVEVQFGRRSRRIRSRFHSCTRDRKIYWNVILMTDKKDQINFYSSEYSHKFYMKVTFANGEFFAIGKPSLLRRSCHAPLTSSRGQYARPKTMRTAVANFRLVRNAVCSPSCCSFR